MKAYVDHLVDEGKKFIYRHREEVETLEGREIREDNPLTFHGSGYSFAQELHRDNIANGMSEEESRMVGCDRLGHGENREDIKHIYLGRSLYSK
jgi:hypothetical protein